MSCTLYVLNNIQPTLGLHHMVNTTLVTTFVTLSFKAKTECIPLCVPRSSFTHKAANSEINNITSVYYIKSYYKTYAKTTRSK
jgi:hypothetical protein